MMPPSFRWVEIAVLVVLVLGLVAFTAGAPLPGLILEPDPLTAIMLLFVTVCWGLYSYAARQWQRSLSLLRPAENPEGPVATLLDQLALRQIIPFDGGRRLRTGATDALVQELSSRPQPLGPPYWLATGQGVLVSLGLIGTFLGLSYGLLKAVPKLQGDPAAMQVGMQALLGGAKLAFVKSLAGVLCAMVWGVRYRRLEEERDELLAGCKDWLDERYPSISSEALLAKMMGEQTTATAALDQRLAKMEQALVAEQRGILGAIGHADAQVGQVVTGLSIVGGVVKQSSTAITTELAQGRQAVTHQEHAVVSALQTLSDDEREKLSELIDTVRQLAEQLPQQIGPNVGQVLAGLLGPVFAQLTEALKKLSDASGETLEGAVERGAGEAVTRLSGSLQEVAKLLQALPEQLNQRVVEANGLVQDGTKRMVGDLEVAGNTVAGELRVAATDLTAVHERLNDTVLEVRALTENLAGYGEQIQKSLGAAEKSAAALTGHAQGMEAGVQKVTRPLGDVAARLEAVPGTLTAATETMRTEHKALAGLGLELKAQAESVRGQHVALQQRIDEYRQLQAALAGQWATQMQGVLKANVQVKDAWTTAVEAAQKGVQENAKRIATYALDIEKSVRVPTDLRNLDSAIRELVDVLDELKATLGSRK